MELSKLAQSWLESWQSDQSPDGKKISAEEMIATFELAKSDGVNFDEYQAMGEIISHIKKLETHADYRLHSSTNGPFTWLWHAQQMTQDYSVEDLIFKDHLPPSLALEKYLSGLSLTSSTVPYTEKMFDGLEYYCGRLSNNYIFNDDVCSENTLWLKSNGKPPLDLQVSIQVDPWKKTYQVFVRNAAGQAMALQPKAIEELSKRLAAGDVKVEVQPGDSKTPIIPKDDFDILFGEENKSEGIKRLLNLVGKTLQGQLDVEERLATDLGWVRSHPGEVNEVIAKITNLRHPKVVGELVLLLSDDRFPLEVKKVILHQLGSIGGVEAMEALVKVASLGKEELANTAAKVLERDFYHYVSDNYEIGRQNLQLKDSRLTYYLIDALVDPSVSIDNKQRHILPLLRRIPDFKVAGTIVGILTSGQALSSHYVADLLATLDMVAESAEDHMRYDSYLLSYGSSIPIEWQVERAVKLAEGALFYFRNNDGIAYWSNSWASGAYLSVKNFLNLKVKRAASPDPKWVERLEQALAPFEIKK